MNSFTNTNIANFDTTKLQAPNYRNRLLQNLGECIGIGTCEVTKVHGLKYCQLSEAIMGTTTSPLSLAAKSEEWNKLQR